MFKYRPALERGITKEQGRTLYHSFTFDRYYNQNYLGCSDLRVLNEIELEPQKSLEINAENNQDILTILLFGSLEYKDSEGKIMTIEAGEAQIIHSSKNISYTLTNISHEIDAQFLQIWISSQVASGESQKVKLPKGYARQLLASNLEGALLTLNQQADIYFCHLGSGESYINNDKDSYFWLQMISGTVEWGDMLLQAGDGLHFYNTENELKTISNKAEFLLFRMNVPK